MSDPQVLVVGAGPTGLLLALWLTRRGIRVRIIDKVAEPGTTSRALVVHARTLEFYRQLGIADEIVRQGREFVADVAATGQVMNGELHIALDEADFLAVFPLHDNDHARLVGIVRTDMLENMDELSWEDVSKTVISWLGIQVDRVHWFSTYHVHHRVAEHFQKGRVFLLGDAAHIHSPVGGQGMNTGLGDAVNLAWKLADVLHDRAAPKLLDTYEPERIAFAKRLIASTDRAFTFVTSPGRFARFVRTILAPRILPMLFRSTAFRRLQFRIVSQIAINYRHSSLSRGETQRLKSGDRLPWVAPSSSTATDNFTPLESLDWQVHIYGDCDPSIRETCLQRGLPLQTFEWSERAATAGLAKDALYLIRPDGYIAFADAAPSPSSLDAYLKPLQ